MFKLRFFWVLIKAYLSMIWAKRSAKSELPFWVTPFECDINLHCNNASYLKYMDLGRWDLLLRAGMLGRMIQEKMQPNVVRVEIDFKKALPPVAYFRLITEFVGVTARSFQISQQFFWKGEIAAQARVTGVFIRNGKAVPLG